jgi:two-component system response regulator AtoC
MVATPVRVLIVDDDPDFLALLSSLVAGRRFEVVSATTLAEARARIAAQSPDVVLVDLELPDGCGLDLLDGRQPADPEVVLITGRASLTSAVDALRRGATDYLTKPVDVPHLNGLLDRLTRGLQVKRERGVVRSDGRTPARFGALVGASPAMQAVYDLVERVARTDAATLLTGETGTGKEVVARTIHGLGARRKKPFVAVDCGSVSPSLIESELFGHERGSFTGAERIHRGYFERAHPGTLFLDEITETPLELQVKLLRVLETSTVTRVGAEAGIPIDVRIVAATNRPLDAALAEGRLREDLFYRLHVFPIELPPLRERGDDVELLAEHFLAQLNVGAGTSKRLTPASGARIRRHPWPGNLRELRNVVHRAFILAAGDAVDLIPGEGPVTSTLAIPLGTSLAESERQLVLAALDRFEGDTEKVAAALQITPTDLRARLRRYKAEPD